MILRSLLRLAARASLVALATASVAVGCSRQGEGERCDLAAAGYDDCDSGLICVSCLQLQGHVTDRCCPPGASSDPRCARSPSEAKECVSALGTGGTTGTAGSAGTAGSSTAGAGGSSGTAGASSGGTAGEDDPAGAGGA